MIDMRQRALHRVSSFGVIKKGFNDVMKATLLLILSFLAAGNVSGQSRVGDFEQGSKRKGVRSVTIPVTVHLPKGQDQREEVSSIDVLRVYEDGELQETLTIRGEAQSPLTLAVLIQDDLVSTVSLEIAGIAEFIRRLPPGSRVMVGYLRAGSLGVRQKFTHDLEKAANALRIPLGSSAGTPYNPFTQLRDALKRFEGQPIGRRAVLLISDGLDLSRGVSSSTPSQSLDLQLAINEAQRRGVAVYSIYSPTAGGTGGASSLIGNGQSSLLRLTNETGGYAFFQGLSAPVSFKPYLRDLSTMLMRQFALTYLSTHTSKGFHRIRIESNLSEGNIRHPSGYMR